MDDLISRQAAMNCFHDWIDKRGDIHTPDEMAEYRAIEALPSAQPEIIRCKDCVNHVDRNFCRKANHYTGDGEYCASVFGAERRTDEAD